GVVKADGYGHGAVPAARAALAGGASWLAVALVSEGVALRDAGIDAPVLVLSEPPAEELGEVVARGLTPTLYTLAGVEAMARAVAAMPRAVAAMPRDAGAAGSEREPLAGGPGPFPVHLKVDTGMHRVGADAADALPLAKAVEGCPGLSLQGLWTHLAVADEPENPFTAEQLDRFESVRLELAGSGIRPPIVHAANSAAALSCKRSHHALVRAGIALYGLSPAPGLDEALDLRPALSLRARISHVRHLPAGERLSYGLRYRLERATVVATVPIGYADGVTRRLSALGAEVLVGGRRRPIAGTITMDQLMVDCGDGAEVRPGQEVVLIGPQGDDRIGAEDWARSLDTISYEVVCGIGPRVPRRYRSADRP
ncbi:MAG: alanine racemase, partial [Acidimicrobiales bacterium]